MNTIKTGIIGLGRSGYDIHVHNMGKLPEKFDILAVADPVAERCAEVQKELGCDAYTDYKDLIVRADIDLVINAAPSQLHVPITLEAFEAGHHVLCEKPLARRAEEVDMLIEKSAQKGKQLAIYQQSRFAPYFQQVRKVISSGVLGRVIMVRIAFNSFARRWDWQTLQEYGGGNLRNTGPHPLDQALQLFGTDVMPKIMCIMDQANSFGDAEDHVKLILCGEDRPTIDLEISSCCAYPLYTYQVYGTRGGLTGSTSHVEWRYYREEEAPQRVLQREPLSDRQYCREELDWHGDSWDLASHDKLYENMAQQFYAQLYEALTKDAPLEVKPEHIRQQIAVIEECFKQNPKFHRA